MSLRAVDPKIPAKTKAPDGVLTAARTGSMRDFMVAQRDRIARAVDDPSCPPAALASLSRQLQLIADKIETIDEAEETERSEEETSDGDFDAAAV